MSDKQIWTEKQTWSVHENGLFLEAATGPDSVAQFLHFSSQPLDEGQLDKGSLKYFVPVELHVSGAEQDANHGSKHVGGNPGLNLRHHAWSDGNNSAGRKIEWTLVGGALEVVVHWQFYHSISVLRSWTVVTNRSNDEVCLEYVSSFALIGLLKDSVPPEAFWDDVDDFRVSLPHSTWYGEAQWKDYRLSDLGLERVNEFSMKRIQLGQTGTWPCSEHLPMGALVGPKTSLVWQIEAPGSWHWEVSDQDRQLYLRLSGPTFQEHQWMKRLLPNESFETVPVAIASVNGGFNDAMSQLNEYRRRIRRPHNDNVTLPIIFNDYMNCLWGDPTTEKLLPLIDAAAESGCEYFVIDAGWYSDGPWWDGVGEWLPSKERFPGGIKEPLDRIRARGMIPGLWLELEVMGIRCPLVDRVDDSWFFSRNGKRVVDRGRHQLDFRNPEVVKHADSVVARLVNDYGVGYIKMDYNNNTGVGTEVAADSFGDGLLQHNRAYLKWLADTMERYPSLVIENCSSGGMRMEYSHLSLHSLQSVTDQTDYLQMAAIAAGCATAVSPEQAAIWSYPLQTGDREEVVFNMVNALLLRVHQSGHLAQLSAERFGLVKEGLSLYKTYRSQIASAKPLWPLGLPTLRDEWLAFGLNFANGTILLAVWRIDGEQPGHDIEITLSGTDNTARVVYPRFATSETIVRLDKSCLKIQLEKKTARLIAIEPTSRE